MEDIKFLGNMIEEYAIDICNWNYDGGYSVYNMPSFDEAKKKNYSIANPSRYSEYLCYGINKELVAYIKLNFKENNEIYVGIGLKPNVTGKGLGKHILNFALEYIKQNYASYTPMLEVRSWNTRAIKCYTAVGFKPVKTIMQTDKNGVECEFVIMKYEI